jgi:hypothetical protein
MISFPVEQGKYKMSSLNKFWSIYEKDNKFYYAIDNYIYIYSQ